MSKYILIGTSSIIVVLLLAISFLWYDNNNLRDTNAKYEATIELQNTTIEELQAHITDNNSNSNKILQKTRSIYEENIDKKTKINNDDIDTGSDRDFLRYYR